jgi:hypothetical protein
MKFSEKQKYLFCFLLTLAIIVVLFFFPPIAQDSAYHSFADQRNLLGIPNFWNVISNLPFLIVTLLGVRKLNSVNGFDLALGYILLAGIFLTGIGSGWYHLSPSNNSLVWDRLPMTIVFMPFFCLLISDRIGEKIAKALLIPLLALGIGSVFYWAHTESLGRGDLRMYGFVQFYPMVMIPLMLILFKGKRSINRELWLIILFYGASKLTEHFDQQIFDALKFMSGHAIKHMLAAVATWYIVKSFQKPYTSKSS